jgi:hypothetical protein
VGRTASRSDGINESVVTAPNQWEDGSAEANEPSERSFTGDESDIDCISDDEPFTSSNNNTGAGGGHGDVDYHAKLRWSFMRNSGNRNWLINHGEARQLKRW